jgi:hypothetical protein
MESKRGGKRPGSGRKKGLASIASEEARKYVVSRIYEEIEPIITGQIEMAKGVYYEKGKEKIYQKLPDNKVAEYLLNQLVGIPKPSTFVLEKNAPSISEEEKKRIDRILGLSD